MSKQVIGGLLIAASLIAVNWDSVKTYLPDSQPAVVQEDKVTEAEVWKALQRWCEAGKVAGTDELVRLCRSLKDLGYLSDISRTEKYATEKNQPLTPEIIASLSPSA